MACAAAVSHSHVGAMRGYTCAAPSATSNSFRLLPNCLKLGSLNSATNASVSAVLCDAEPTSVRFASVSAKVAHVMRWSALSPWRTYAPLPSTAQCVRFWGEHSRQKHTAGDVDAISRKVEAQWASSHRDRRMHHPQDGHATAKESDVDRKLAVTLYELLEHSACQQGRSERDKTGVAEHTFVPSSGSTHQLYW